MFLVVDVRETRVRGDDLTMLSELPGDFDVSPERVYRVARLREGPESSKELNPALLTMHEKEALIAMTQYRVYSGPQGSERIRPLEKDHLLFKQFAALDEPIGWARHLDGSGRVALLIEGDDGTRLTAPEIVATLRHSEFESSEKAKGR